jgi:enoyl-CoA hydratase/carnithine racemase
MLQQQPAQLRTERVGEIAVLTIDRPARRNALGQQLIEELISELDRADRDPATRVIVLTGSAPGFCAGSDLKELAGMDLASMGAHEAHTATLARSIAFMNKPVVAGIEGFALGGGFVRDVLRSRGVGSIGAAAV